MPETKVARMRVRAVRFKNGGEVRLLRFPTAEDDRRFVEAQIKRALDSHPDRVAGFAFVVWGPDNGSVATQSANDLSRIPSIMIGEFVKNRLLASTIERWTMENFEEVPNS